MKILLLSDSLIKGGRERRMIELIKGLLERSDVQMELVLFANVIDYPEIHDLDIPLHILERKPKKDPRVFYRFYQLCKRFQPDVIHTWSSMCAIFAYPAIKLLNIKLANGNIANAPHNLKIWDKELFRAKLTFPFSDIIIGNSEAGLKAYYAPKSKSLCIHNGFDFKRISKLKDGDEIRNRLQIKTKHVVAKIAAFTNRKDYTSYIEAALKIVRMRDNVTFLGIGGGPNLDKMKALVPERYIDKIIFTGPQFDVESIVNIITIGVLSTNIDIHGEGISNSIMEYMVLGKPVVATEGGGTNEIVVDNLTGFLIPPKSPEVFAEKMLELLDNPEKAKQMGEAGRQRIYDHFNLAKMTEIYYQLYKDLINGNKILALKSA
jgi:glycosyltransferase involved in cell wall biosynthesis